jgi:uncharacterized protein YfdQ (DUF2303 family)
MSEEIQTVRVTAPATEIAKPLVMTLGTAERTFAVLPPAHVLHDVTQYMAPPPRAKQKVHLLSVQAFIDYVNRYREGSSTVFANEKGATYEAVIDYHPGEEDPAEVMRRGNCDHIAHYACPTSEQWQLWQSSDKKWFGQEEFANFIECNLRDIKHPSGATLMQVALELQVHKGAQFSSEVRLESGQRRFRYDETVRGTTRAGDLEVPSAFQIEIPVFIDGEHFNLDARFRYRMVEGGALSIGYELIRPLDVFREAIKLVTKQVTEGLEECQVYAGVRG